MAKRTIKIRSFSFTNEKGELEVDGAMRGERVELSKEAIEFGEGIGAFEGKAASKPDPDAGPQAPALPDYSAMSVEEIAEDLKANKRTIPAIMNIVDGDAAVARKVIDAEEAATGGNSRPTLVEGLAAVVSNAAQ